ncbi:alpha/beta fold hydrolase [Caulobacter soli]|uniref:alpha/beta fold hydrolase n=1 Tax=Caulobacter soli TaxID=2708539 RepID=UPI0013ECBDBE|nr:alpha/beta hydrolase [Caulobacter soli]
MRRRLPVVAWACLLALPLVSCGDEGARAPFAESRTPPSLDVRFQPPPGWAWGYVKVGDDLVQRYGVSAPPGAPRGQILILPGYGESAEGWFETARELNDRGYVVWILERQGQGGSERATPWRDLGHAVSFAPDVTATKAMVKAVIRPSGRDPFVILGASDGGLVALRAMEEGLRADAAILSSPNFDLADPPRAKGELIRVARWARGLKLGFVRYPGQPGWKREGPDGFGARLTHDRARGSVQQAWDLANPDLRMGAPSLAWYAAFYDAVDATGRDLKRVDIPVAMLDAGQDVKALPDPQSTVCAALPHCVKTRWPQARHALHLETDSVRDPWLKAIDDTLRLRMIHPSPKP